MPTVRNFWNLTAKSNSLNNQAIIASREKKKLEPKLSPIYAAKQPAALCSY